MPQQQTPSDICMDAVLRVWGERQESVTCILTGDCMAPRLMPGMELVIHLGAHRPRCGDVAMVQSPSGRLVQRIVRIVRDGRGRGYLLKPDHRWEFHGPVGEEDVLGVVVGIITPKGVRQLNTLSQRFLASWLAWRSYISGSTFRPTGAAWRILAIPARAWRRLRGRLAEGWPQEKETEGLS